MWAPLTPDADHRGAIPPEANDSAGSANTAVAPGTPACQAQLSFTTTPQPPSPMNEDCEGPTVFGFPENAGALRNLTRDDLHLRFPSGSLSGSPVALINKIQYLLTMLCRRVRSWFATKAWLLNRDISQHKATQYFTARSFQDLRLHHCCIAICDKTSIFLQVAEGNAYALPIVLTLKFNGRKLIHNLGPQVMLAQLCLNL